MFGAIVMTLLLFLRFIVPLSVLVIIGTLLNKNEVKIG